MTELITSIAWFCVHWIAKKLSFLVIRNVLRSSLKLCSRNNFFFGFCIFSKWDCWRTVRPPRESKGTCWVSYVGDNDCCSYSYVEDCCTVMLGKRFAWHWCPFIRFELMSLRTIALVTEAKQTQLRSNEWDSTSQLNESDWDVHTTKQRINQEITSLR